jgi:DNA repair protein RecO (recombination protein O)
MPPVTTDAIVLHTFPYGETSRIARLLTPEYGVQSVVAKGAMRPKSRMGSALQVFSAGSLRFYYRQHRDLHTLAGFDVSRPRPGLARDVRRFAAASAVAELLIRFAPAEHHPEIFALASDAFDVLGSCPDDAVEPHALAALWAVVVALGFSPSLDQCARDGGPVAEGAAVFSVSDGGVLCDSCAATLGRRPVPAEDRAAIERFVFGAVPTDGMTDDRLAAHRRLLTRFVERHVAEGRDLPALEQWGAVA